MAITLQDYSTLREVQSVDIYVKTHMDKIKSERQRTEQICRMRQNRTEKVQESKGLLNEINLDISTIEKDLFSTETNLAQARANLASAASESQMKSLEKQIDEGQKKVDALEDQILSKLTETEAIETSIEEDKKFLEGSLETLREIESEVEKIVQEEEKQIDHYNTRIDNLLKDIPPALSNAFTQARNKHRFNNPITKIKGNACMMCRFILDSQTSSQVELFRSIEFCGQCERLVAPLEA
jgi:predicted  nucleic acid-binding Zn-ribbon protein